MSGKRVYILCEDRMTERFLRNLCRRFSVKVVDANPQPSAEGAASAWVRKNYAEKVVKLRSKNYQQNLGLLVGLDGDNRGGRRRNVELEEALRAAGEAPRSEAEPIAIFTPTWCIETWLAHLCGRSSVREDRSLKLAQEYRALWDSDGAAAATIKTAVDAWGAAPDAVASLADAYREASRVGLS